MNVIALIRTVAWVGFVGRQASVSRRNKLKTIVSVFSTAQVHDIRPHYEKHRNKRQYNSTTSPTPNVHGFGPQYKKHENQKHVLITHWILRTSQSQRLWQLATIQEAQKSITCFKNTMNPKDILFREHLHIYTLTRSNFGLDYL